MDRIIHGVIDRMRLIIKQKKSIIGTRRGGAAPTKRDRPLDRPSEQMDVHMMSAICRALMADYAGQQVEMDLPAGCALVKSEGSIIRIGNRYRHHEIKGFELLFTPSIRTNVLDM
jgi:hypothetical protein